MCKSSFCSSSKVALKLNRASPKSKLLDKIYCRSVIQNLSEIYQVLWELLQINRKIDGRADERIISEKYIQPNPEVVILCQVFVRNVYVTERFVSNHTFPPLYYKHFVCKQHFCYILPSTVLFPAQTLRFFPPARQELLWSRRSLLSNGSRALSSGINMTEA